MITFPVKAQTLFTLTGAKLLTLFVSLFAMLLNYPRFFGWSLVENRWKDIPSLEELDYVMKPNAQAKFIYHTIGGLHNHIDFGVALPTLLVFNLLSFWKVHQLSKRRKELKLNEKLNIRAIKMFLPVVIVYFLANIQPMIYVVNTTAKAVTFREERVVLYLCIAVNSAVNLPIYYFRSMPFRQETKNVFADLMQKFGVKISKAKWAEESGGTVSGTKSTSTPGLSMNKL